MIPKTYHNGNTEDRNFNGDFFAWLQTQPQDAWLLFVRTQNWDQADRIVLRMVNDPKCDLSVAAWVFWNRNPQPFTRDSGDELTAAILRNVKRGFYKKCDLLLDRLSVWHGVHQFLRELREAGRTKADFELPRILLGPFDGKPAQLPKEFAEEVEADLEDILRHYDAALPRSEAESVERRSRAWAVGIELPNIDASKLRSLPATDDIARLEAIYGPHEDFLVHRQKLADEPIEFSLRQRLTVALPLLLFSVSGLTLVYYLGWFDRR